MTTVIVFFCAMRFTTVIGVQKPNQRPKSNCILLTINNDQANTTTLILSVFFLQNFCVHFSLAISTFGVVRFLCGVRLVSLANCPF